MRKYRGGVYLGCVMCLCAVVAGAIRLWQNLGLYRYSGQAAKFQPIQASEYDYSLESEMVNPQQEVRNALCQWPVSAADQMHAMAGRLERVASVLNHAANAEVVVMLGETAHAAVSHGDGRIVVDASMLWRLSENALACLLAHEMGHELLGHRRIFDRLTSQGSGVPAVQQQYRDLELAADEYAGQLVSRTPYGAAGFAELLSRVRSTDWESPLIRDYYSHGRRLAAFELGYDRGTGVRLVSATRPTLTMAASSPAG